MSWHRDPSASTVTYRHPDGVSARFEGDYVRVTLWRWPLGTGMLEPQRRAWSDSRSPSYAERLNIAVLPLLDRTLGDVPGCAPAPLSGDWLLEHEPAAGDTHCAWHLLDLVRARRIELGVSDIRFVRLAHLRALDVIARGGRTATIADARRDSPWGGDDETARGADGGADTPDVIE